MAGAASVDEYLAALPEGPRAALEEVRQAILAAAPEAVETIAYDMPAYRVGDRFLVSFGAYKRHYSLFPASGWVLDALADEMKPYYSGKGTIRFAAGKPIPIDLVTKVVEVRRRELAARDRR